MLLAGCGAALSQLAPAPQAVLGSGVVRKQLGAGPELAVFRRAGGSHAQLGLFVDAGSRDAEIPQVATLAAWLAGEAGGSSLRTRVLPDGVEHLLACERSQLASCLGRLAAVLGARKVKPTRLAAALERLIEARRRAHAADPGRSADALALRALYGNEAGLLPLGRPQHDARIDATEVEAFLAAHYGPGRALLVVAGELELEAVARAASAAFARLPAAAEARAGERPAPATDGVLVEVASERRMSLAVAAPELAQARAAALAIRTRLARDGLARDLSGHVFAVRGAALALLRVGASDPAASAQAIGHELARLRSEGLTAPSSPSAGSDAAAVQRLGMRWMTAGAPEPVPTLRLGVGVLAAGGRADQPKQSDPDAALRERTQTTLEAAFERGLALGAPAALSTEHGDSSASATLENGARLQVRLQPGEEVAIAVRFAAGAATDPPLWHGRAALLATLVTTACKGSSAAQLTADLEALGARLSPRVDPESWGVLLQAPAANWAAALTLALDCALHPRLSRSALVAARARLLERHGGDEGALALQAAVAASVQAEVPGALAPWGSPARQASVELPALRELWTKSATGARVSVVAVGPVQIERALGLLARRLALLPAAAAETRALAREPPAPALPPQLDSAAPERPTLALVVWRTPAAAQDASGALAFAAVMRAALGGLADAQAIWHGAGAARGAAFAAVALRGPTEQLAAVCAQLAALGSSTPAPLLERAVEQVLEHAQRARSAAAGDPAAQADALAAGAFAAAIPAASREAARALARALLAVTPAWLPLR